MPRTADHDARRRQIAEAVWRLASTAGLEDVTLRKVATEAGVSMRLVQYYFGTRHELLTKSLEMLNADATIEATRRIEAVEDTSPRGLLRAVLLEMLPLDERRRTRYLVHLAYFVRSLTDDALAELFGNAPSSLEQLVAGLLAGTRAADGRGGDAALDAEILLSSIDGLATRLLLGQRDAEQVIALVDHQIAGLVGDEGSDAG